MTAAPNANVHALAHSAYLVRVECVFYSLYVRSTARPIAEREPFSSRIGGQDFNVLLDTGSADLVSGW